MVKCYCNLSLLLSLYIYLNYLLDGVFFEVVFVVFLICINMLLECTYIHFKYVIIVGHITISFAFDVMSPSMS
jgi:hypothetical protein